MSENRKRAGTAASVEEDPNAAVACSSPPCFMHELDPAYLGYLAPEEETALLDAVLAAEWSGAVPDEARLRAALRQRSGAPDEAPRCQSDGLAPVIRAALPRIHDDALRRDLQALLAALERGAQDRDGTRAATLTPPPAAPPPSPPRGRGPR